MSINLFSRLDLAHYFFAIDGWIFRNGMRNEEASLALNRKRDETLWMRWCWTGWSAGLFIIPCDKLVITVIVLLYRFFESTSELIDLVLEICESLLAWPGIKVSVAAIAYFWRNFKDSPPFDGPAVVV